MAEVDITITVGVQGPQGIQGATGPSGGDVTVAATAPASPTEGDLWLNSSNQELSVYANSVWEKTTYKSELADDTVGALLIYAGYF